MLQRGSVRERATIGHTIVNYVIALHELYVTILFCYLRRRNQPGLFAFGGFERMFAFSIIVALLLVRV